MDDLDAVREDIKGKKGPELFKELLRHFPLASPDDYYKHGVWQDDLLRLDVQVIAAHRLEAGAPDPLPLSEVKMPELPVAMPSVFAPSLLQHQAILKTMTASGLVLGPRPVGPLTVPTVGTAPAAASSPAAAAAVGKAAAVAAAVAALPSGSPMAKGSVVVPPPGGAGAAQAAADLRQIALFVSKWQLDPTRTSALLTRLSPARRLFVMQNFQATAGTETANAQLGEYLVRCEKTGAWPAVAPLAAVVAPPQPPPAVLPGSAGATAAASAAAAKAASAALAAVASLKRGHMLDGVVQPPGVRPRLTAPAVAVPLVTNPNWKAAVPVPNGIATQVAKSPATTATWAR